MNSSTISNWLFGSYFIALGTRNMGNSTARQRERPALVMRDDGEGVEEPLHVGENTKEESNDRADNKGEMKSSAVYDPQCIYWDDRGNLRLGHSPRDRVEELLQVS